MHRPRSVETADVAGKRVLLRADLNVPLEDGLAVDLRALDAPQQPHPKSFGTRSTSRHE